MKTKNKIGLIFLGIFVSFITYAATPASKTYLYGKIAVIQAQIDAIKLKLAG